MQATTWGALRRDSMRSPGRPWATYLLMLGTIVAMYLEIFVATSGDGLQAMLQTYGLVSSSFSWTDPSTYLPLVTYNFLHGSAKHFGGNAIIMLFACAAVEKYAGRNATLFIWLIGGVAAGIAHLFILPETTRSLVGSSGAISAMMGAAFVIGWRWALPVRIWRGRRKLFSIPLPAVMIIWVAFQVFSFVQVAPQLATVATVATWVHLAGFAFGAVAAMVLCLHGRQPTAEPPLLEPAAAGD